ncbi:hypothetical protein [Jannaschia sp. R86511]|uniref:hypothetical protein n=1 Tax=Jannaschia sp. R86511 TaxID=3093853 RepID=UPI0036D39733
MLVLTGRYYADGDQVSVIVEPGEGHFMIRDAGAAGRLDLAGASVETNRQVQQYWEAIVDDYGCLTVGGRVYLHAEPQRLEVALLQMADALLALDSVRHLAPPGRGDRFDQQVRRWLVGEVGIPVREDRIVRTITGASRRVTAILDPPQARPVVVMAAQRGKAATPLEHAYFVLDQLSVDQWPLRQRMTVLGGPSHLWRESDRLALSKVGYVASREQAVTVGRVARGELRPASLDLLDFDPLQPRLDDAQP